MHPRRHRQTIDSLGPRDALHRPARAPPRSFARQRLAAAQAQWHRLRAFDRRRQWTNVRRGEFIPSSLPAVTSHRNGKITCTTGTRTTGHQPTHQCFVGSQRLRVVAVNVVVGGEIQEDQIGLTPEHVPFEPKYAELRTCPADGRIPTSESGLGILSFQSPCDLGPVARQLGVGGIGAPRSAMRQKTPRSMLRPLGHDGQNRRNSARPPRQSWQSTARRAWQSAVSCSARFPSRDFPNWF